MRKTTSLSCTCRKTRLRVEGKPIVGMECCCNSCRDGAQRMEALEGAPTTLTKYGTAPYILVRKDRVTVIDGAENLAEFRLKPHSKTRRVFATCCNTPMFADFEGGHWLTVFAQLWPEAERPVIEMRSMVIDMPTGTVLPDDIPNAQKYNPRIFAKLMRAWAAMLFRRPKGPVAHKKVDL